MSEQTRSRWGSLRRIDRAKLVAVFVAIPLSGCGRLFGPRATLGPGSIVRGRALYNEVISHTNNEQTLQLIVRARYGESLGLLSVASVTASLKATATSEAQFGIGPSENFQGGLVPLALGLAYEESPTISYVPVQGERYAKGVLGPLPLELLVLLLNVESAPPEIVAVLVKELNGLPNPTHGSPSDRAAFVKTIELFARLKKAGQASWTTSEDGKSFALVLHDYAPSHVEVVRELLLDWHLPESLARAGRDIILPLRFGFGRPSKPELHIQTRSVFDLIDMAAAGVDVPPEHVAEGLTDPSMGTSLLRIRRSRERPWDKALVAVRYRDWWFYVPADDPQAKPAFRLVQTLINLRLVEATPQAAPTLTLPVGR